MANNDSLSRVIIFRGPVSWMIDLRDDPTAGETMDTFGTTILPMAWGLQASLDRVVLALRRQHPAVVITFSDAGDVARHARLARMEAIR